MAGHAAPPEDCVSSSGDGQTTKASVVGDKPRRMGVILPARTRGRPDGRRPQIMLTEAQHQKLLCRSPLFRLWLTEMRNRLWLRAEAAYHHKECSRPLLHGFAVLAAMPVEPSYVDAKSLALAVGLSRHRVEKALYTLSVLGLLEYDPAGNTYRVAQWPS
jgi:hypothetical protein